MKVIVMWSGGKDSQACLIHSVKKYGKKHILAVFCDTGWEHEATVAHVHNVCKDMGVELLVITPEYQFEEMCIKHHIMPSRMRRFCTEDLKIKPFIDWLLDQDESFIIIQGIRSSESKARSQYDVECGYFKEYFDGKATYRKKDVLEWCKTHDASVMRPIFKWSGQDVISYIIDNGQQPNPLYRKGASRVGCFPCIFARLNEIKVCAKDEKYADRLIALEEKVTSDMVERGYKGDKANFFQIGKIPARFCNTNSNGSPTAREVFDYVLRDENQPSLFDESDEEYSCMSLYHGLCE